MANTSMTCNTIKCPLDADYGINRYDQTYTLYCNRDIPGSDISTSLDIETLASCMDLCAATPGCLAFSWTDACDCSVKTNDSGGLNTPSSKPMVSGFVSELQYQLQSKDMVCPYPNLSRQNASNGASYQTVCGSDFYGGDFIPQYISANSWYNTDGAFNIGWHTDTWDECRDQCATSHPLCRHFTFTPGFMWINCFFKNETIQMPTGFSTYPCYSGVLVNDLTLPEEPRKCVNGEKRVAGGMEFKISCNDFHLPAGGTKGILTQKHSESIMDCLTSCAANTTSGAESEPNACVAAMFDATFEFGWDNCYLLNHTGQGLAQRNYTLGYLASEEQHFKPPKGNLDDTHSAVSTGKIVGWVVGGVFLTFIVAIIVLRYRGRNRQRKTGSKSHGHKHKTSGDQHPLVQSESSYEMHSMYASSLDKTSLRSRGTYEIEFTPNFEPLDDSYFNVRME